jgi:hypothetical protein
MPRRRLKILWRGRLCLVTDLPWWHLYCPLCNRKGPRRCRGPLTVGVLFTPENAGMQSARWWWEWGTNGECAGESVKVEVKGNGQECPFHRCESNTKFNGGAYGVRGSHLSQNRRKVGHPRLWGPRSRSGSTSTATYWIVRSTGASLCSLDSRDGCLYMGWGAAHDSRFLARLRRARNDRSLLS